jgi:hypothetical protein
VRKKGIVSVAIGAVIGFSLAIWLSPERKAAAVQDMFPPERLEGQAEFRIGVLEPGTGGGPVLARVVTAYGIRDEQVAPTGYAALKALRKEYPEAPRIAAFLAEDSAMARAGNWVGLAQLHDGAVSVTGGLPSRAQLDSLAALGQPLRRPTPEDLRLAAEVMDSTVNIYPRRWNLSRTLVGAPAVHDKQRFMELDLDTRAVYLAAKARGLPAKDVKARVLDVARYYWLRAGDPL